MGYGWLLLLWLIDWHAMTPGPVYSHTVPLSAIVQNVTLQVDGRLVVNNNISAPEWTRGGVDYGVIGTCVCPPALVLKLTHPFVRTTVLLPAPRYPITELRSSKDIEITGSGVYDGRPPPAAVSKTWVRACGVACLVAYGAPPS